MIDNYPYEIHVTAEHPDGGNMSEQMVHEFKTVCADIGVRPITIKNIRYILDNPSSYDIITERLTQSVIQGSFAEAFDHMRTVVFRLRIAGFRVTREKIETVPWHPAAMDDVVEGQSGNYFESHFKVMPQAVGTEDDVQNNQKVMVPHYPGLIRDVAGDDGYERPYASLIARESSSVPYPPMTMTIRKHRDYRYVRDGGRVVEQRRRTREQFELNVDQVMAHAREYATTEYVREKRDVEYALFDSNEALDNYWMGHDSFDNQRTAST